MDVRRRLALLIGVLSVLAPLAAHAQSGGVIHTLTVPAPSLRGNLVGDPDKRVVSIYLPPSYSKFPRRRYPTLYLLHGFGGDNYTTWIGGKLQNLNVRVSLDSLVRARKVGEMIVVMPNARNRFDGSFYANSPVTGNWEDFIVRDLVGYIDRRYRTIRSRSSRGIAGWSMGGFGALRLAMHHPELFSAVYALSPYGLTPADIIGRNMTKAWRVALALTDTSQLKGAGFLPELAMAVAAVYSPDTLHPPFYFDFPVRAEGDSLVPIAEVIRKYSSVISEASDRARNLRQMKIGFDAGNSDGFTDIPVDVTALHRQLTKLGIPHSFEIFEGTHGNRLRSRLENVVFPFFSTSFAADRARTLTPANPRPSH